MGELEQKFCESQQRLVDAFKQRLVNICNNTLGDLYADVLNYATTDAHVNYHNFLRDEFRESFKKEISEGYGMYSWAHGIRMELLKSHADVLRNRIISDLEEKIASQERTIDELRSRQY